MSPRDRRPFDPTLPRAHRPAPARSEDEDPSENPNENAAGIAMPLVPVPAATARARTPLETVLLASTAALLAAVAWPIASSGWATSEPPPAAVASVAPLATPVPMPMPVDTPTIQIALLLDTSSSMDGLIDQARTQLWSVANALDSATLHGQRPTLEIALYEYGNSELPLETGFIRQVTPFTSELDRVAQVLFELDTMGGSEHAGQVIARSLDELAWREGGLKVIYIAGNEELEQGPVDWRGAITRARGRGIVVNTLNCSGGGSPDEGWADAAALAGGRFLQIDHDAVAVHVAAPQDDEIARLGAALNRTYVGYGREGKWGLENQVAQDDNASRSGSGSAVQRALTKASGSYRNPSWDLVDALDSKTVTLSEVNEAELPPEARGLSGAALDGWVDGKRKERESIQTQLAALTQARAEHVAAAQADASGPARLDTAIVDSILEQAKDAGFTIEPAA